MISPRSGERSYRRQTVEGNDLELFQLGASTSTVATAKTANKTTCSSEPSYCRQAVGANDLESFQLGESFWLATSPRSGERSYIKQIGST